MNTFGVLFRFTSFGESHGAAVGGVIDGCPAGLKVDFEAIRLALDRRAGRGILSIGASQRAVSAADEVQWLSGLYEGTTLGTPIAFLLPNDNARAEDYAELQHVFRPSHADFTYQAKYGIRDYRGGGRASARETAARVVAGEIARQYIQQQGISVRAWVSQLGGETRPDRFAALLQQVAAQGDSVGGIVSCQITGLSAGIGEPIFGKLQARLAAAMLSIGGAKGFDYGSGFEQVEKLGSELNDPYEVKDGVIRPATNHAGGILGGISTGEDILFRVAFKPTASIAREQQTVNDAGESVTLQIKGRHDVSVVPRAVAVVEAMAALVVADALLIASAR